MTKAEIGAWDEYQLVYFSSVKKLHSQGGSEYPRELPEDERQHFRLHARLHQGD